MSSLLDEAGITAHAGQRCLKCNKPLSPATSICIHCGYNSATGQSFQTSVKGGGQGDAHGGATEYLLSKAAEELKKTPVAKADAGGNPFAAYILTLVAFVVAGVVMFFAWTGFQMIEKSGNSYYWAGLVMVVLGSIFNLVSAIAFLVLGFKESTLTGLAVLFIPCYAYYFAIIKGQGFWVALSIMGTIFGNVGVAMIMYLAEEAPKAMMLFVETASMLA